MEEAAPGVLEIRGRIALGTKPVLSTAPIVQPAGFGIADVAQVFADEGAITNAIFASQ